MTRILLVCFTFVVCACTLPLPTKGEKHHDSTSDEGGSGGSGQGDDGFPVLPGFHLPGHEDGGASAGGNVPSGGGGSSSSDGGSSGIGGDPSSDGGTGGSPHVTPLCVPGASIGCVGPGGCSGYQVCASDGMHYDPCICETDPTGGAGGGDAGGAGTGGSGVGGSDPGPVTGTLQIGVLSRDQTTPHAYALYDWIDPVVTTQAKYALLSKTLKKGIDYTFNGTTDGSSWWCGGAGQKTVLIAALWNGLPIKIETVPNGGSGCNFTVHTSAVTCPANDQDCDGYTSNNANVTLRDCDDTHPFRFPYQFETWGDQTDYDCNVGTVGQQGVDPPSWKYALGGLAQGAYLVELVDTGSWSNQANDFTRTYTMTWNGSTAKYEASVGDWIAPTEYVVRFKVVSGDAWYWTPYKNGSCVIAPYTHQVTETFFNTVVSFATEATYCHLRKQ